MMSCSFKNNSFWRNTLLFNLKFIILLYSLSFLRKKEKYRNYWGKLSQPWLKQKTDKALWKFPRQKYYRDWMHLRLWIRWSEFLHEHKSLKHSSYTWFRVWLLSNMCIWLFKTDYYISRIGRSQYYYKIRPKTKSCMTWFRRLPFIYIVLCS